jgi:ATP-dependent DNA ligase
MDPRDQVRRLPRPASHRQRGRNVFTRNGHDWTKRFKKIAHDAFLISASSAIIDGEVVVPAADGTTDFSVLQNELKGRSTKIVLIAFDLLYLNGYDLRKLPLVERKTLLKKLIAKTAIQFSESFEADGPEMFKHACGIGLEGVVSEVRDSRYNSGRGNDWVKKTCAQRETLRIAGFAPEGKPVRRALHRSHQGQPARLRRQDWSWLRRGLDQGSAGPVKAADPQDPALRQEDRPPGHLG